jgi:membrane protease YdiL (CAAX protease family)
MDTDGQCAVNWKRVGLFLGLTFGLTWVLDLAVWLTVGYGPRALVALQLQMLIPGFCAVVLGMYVFEDHPIYQARLRRELPRVFYYYFMFYSLLVALAAAAPLVSSDPSLLVAATLTTQVLTLLGLVILVVVRIFGGREAFVRAGLGGGLWRYWLLFSLGFILFYAAQAALNAAFGLGEAIDPAQLLRQLPPEQAEAIPSGLLLLLVGVQSVVLGPVIGLLIAFGEEYGWRGYLQGELTRLGKVRGILLLGMIWGLWHAPVIAMGHNYPGYPLLGILLMTVYTVGLGFALGYAFLKSGSVLLVAWLHALNNQVWSFLSLVVYKPAHPVLSFGLGLYGLACLLAVALLLLLDPVWRQGSLTATGRGNR